MNQEDMASSTNSQAQSTLVLNPTKPQVRPKDLFRSTFLSATNSIANGKQGREDNHRARTNAFNQAMVGATDLSLSQNGFSLSQGFNLSSAAMAKQNAYVLTCVPNLDESIVITAVSDSTLQLYDARNGLSRTQVLRAHNGRICDVEADKNDQNLFYSAGEDGKAFVWDARSGSEPVMSVRKKQTPLASVSVGLSSSLLATGSEAGDESGIEFYDIRSGGLLGEFNEAHTEAITQLMFNPSRPSQLVSASLDGLVCCFDVAKAGEEEALQGVMNAEASIQRIGFFGTSSECLFCITHSESLSLYHVEQAACIASFAQAREVLRRTEKQQPDFLIDCLYVERSLHSKGQNLMLVSGSHNGDMFISDIGSDGIEPVCTLSSPYGHRECIRATSFLDRRAKNGLPHRIVSCGEDSLLCDWTANLGTKCA